MGLAEDMNQLLVREDDLKRWLGYDHPSKVKDWLSERGIPFEESRGKIVTTIHAINAALIGADQKQSGFEFG